MKKTILSLLAFGLMLSCQPETAPETSRAESTSDTASEEVFTLTPEQVQVAGIRLAAPEKKVMAYSLRCTGKINVPPENVFLISAVLKAFVSQIRVLPGQNVRKGEVLAVLQHPDYILMQQQYLEAKSRIGFVEKENERQRILMENDAGVGREYERTQAEWQGLKVQIAALASQLRLIGISPERLTSETMASSVQLTAPQNGFVTDVYVNTGSFVEAGSPVCRMLNPTHLHAELQVFEKDIAKVQAGQQVSLSVPGNETLPPVPSFIQVPGQNIDPATRAANVQAHIDRPPAYLIPGMFVQALIHVSPDTVMTLPVEALVRNGRENVVFIAESDHVFRKVPVQIGTQEEGRVAILNPEALSGRQVVIAGGNYIGVGEEE